MPRYRVTMTRVEYQELIVDAANETEAKAKANDKGEWYFESGTFEASDVFEMDSE